MSEPSARPPAAPAETDDPVRSARILRRLCWMVLATMVFLAAVAPFASPLVGPRYAVYLFIAGGMALSLALLRRGRTRAAGMVAIATSWASVTGAIVAFGGTRSPSFFAYIAVVLFAGLVHSRAAMGGVAALSIAAGLGVVWAEGRGLLPEPVVPITAARFQVALATLVVVSAAMLALAQRSIREAFAEARAGEDGARRAAREVERRVHQQEGVAKLGQQALETRNLDALLDRAVRLVADTLDVDCCKVLELTPQRDGLLVRAGVGWREGVVGSAVVGLQRESQPGYTLDSPEPVVVTDFARETRFGPPALLREHEVASGISCVISGRAWPYGVIGAHSRRPRRFSRADAHFVQAVANVISAAIEHDRLDHQLRHAEKLDAVGQLAGGVAHDFNNFLTAIAGQAELLASQKGMTRETEEAANEILETAHRAARLTRQLLTFGRQQSRQPQRIDLNDVVRSASRILESLAGESVVVRHALAADPAVVVVDPAEIEQVLVNLVANARDAMPQGGTLTLATARVPWPQPPERRDAGGAAREAVALAVTDSGVGMDAETRERAFEPFFTTKAPGRGTGLGLASVYGIVEQAGGEIAVESEPGRGSRFEILLPAAEAAPGAAEARAPSPGRAEDGRETVLLVEDEPAVRSVLRHGLEARGYTVVEARDGLEALALLEEGALACDVVVSDLVMPRLGGAELCERLRTLRPETPVILMSGYDPHPGARPSLPATTPLLAKPFAPRALVRRVREVLDRERELPDREREGA